MAAASEVCLCDISQDTSRKTLRFFKLSLAGRQRRRRRLFDQLRRDGADAEPCRCRWCTLSVVVVSVEMRSSGFWKFGTTARVDVSTKGGG